MDEYYNTIAGGYDELYREEQITKAEQAITCLQEHDITPQGLILDVGAGTGISSELFVKQGCRCVLLDPSRGMLRHSNLNNVIKVVGSGEKIPFPNEFFDGVISLTALHHCNVEKAKREIERVVKPKGWIAISLLRENVPLYQELFQDYELQEIGKDMLFFKKSLMSHS